MRDRMVVLVTCGKPAEARRIGRALVEKRLAACVNIVSAPVHSVYRWKGKVESAREWLLVIKTSRRAFRALCAEVERLHSYEVPEVIALPIVRGSKKYLDWLTESVGAQSQRAARKKK